MTVFLKPKDQKPRPKKRRTRKKLVAVKVLDDGREVCNVNCSAGQTEYLQRKFAMSVRQNWLCALCGEWMCARDATFDHETPRSGGRRDDRIEVDGVWKNASVHGQCNYKKGSRRIPYLKHAVNKPAVRR